jgi:hypothetical protein
MSKQRPCLRWLDVFTSWSGQSTIDVIDLYCSDLSR